MSYRESDLLESSEPTTRPWTPRNRAASGEPDPAPLTAFSVMLSRTLNLGILVTILAEILIDWIPFLQRGASVRELWLAATIYAALTALLNLAGSRHHATRPRSVSRHLLPVNVGLIVFTVAIELSDLNNGLTGSFLLYLRQALSLGAGVTACFVHAAARQLVNRGNSLPIRHFRPSAPGGTLGPGADLRDPAMPSPVDHRQFQSTGSNRGPPRKG